MAKILYCAPAWYGFSSAADLNKLESFLRHCKRTGYCTPDMSTVTEQMNDAGDKLFHTVLRNQHRMLQCFLADDPDLVYNLRPSKHNKTVISKTAELNNRNFLLRMLHRDCYEHPTFYSPFYHVHTLSRLSARMSQKTTRPRLSLTFLYTLPIAIARSSSNGKAIRYALPVLWMTSRFPMVERTGLFFVEFARWQHRRWSLSSHTVVYSGYDKEHYYEYWWLLNMILKLTDYNQLNYV